MERSEDKGQMAKDEKSFIQASTYTCVGLEARVCVTHYTYLYRECV